jgi:hypothetical protein
VERALSRLPADHAQAMVLFYLARLPIVRIAARLHRPEGTIKRWLHLGRRQIACEMKEYAPMDDPKTKAPEAALLYESLDPGAVREMTEALEKGGFSRVIPLKAFPALDREGLGDRLAFHLPDDLKACRFFLMEERFDRRSAFEWFLLLKATQEGRQAMSGLLVHAPIDSTIFAAWTAGFELCLTLPVNPAELQRFAEKLLEQLKERETSGKESP